jgi:hypothetical protein
MLDKEKLELFEQLLAYLIVSSTAIDSAARTLEADPLHASQLVLLNESLDAAKILLTMVFNPSML